MKVSTKYSKTYSSDTTQAKHVSNIVYATMALEGQKVTKAFLTQLKKKHYRLILLYHFLSAAM